MFERGTGLALGLFIIFALISVFAYREMLRQEGERVTILSEIKEGEQVYDLKSSERCIGQLRTKFDAKQSFLSISSKLAYQLGNEKNEFSLDSLWGFNQLGQAVGLRVLLSLHSGWMEVVGEGANPINLKIKIKAGDKLLEKSLSVPGPLMLETNPEGKISLYLSRATISKYPQLNLPTLSEMRNLALIMPQNSVSEACYKSGQSEALKLDALYDPLKNFLP